MKYNKSYIRYPLTLFSLLTSTVVSAADFVITVPYEITNNSGFSWDKTSISCMVNSVQEIDTGFSGASMRLYASGNRTFTPTRSATTGVFKGETTVDVNVTSGLSRDPAKEKAYYCVIAIIKTDRSMASNREVNSGASTLRVKGRI